MKTIMGKRILAGIMIGIMSLGLVGCGVPMTTTRKTITDDRVEEDKRLVSGSNVVEEDTNDDLEEIQGMIDKYFYFDCDDEAMQAGIIKGYMESLDDPYSVYYTPEEYADFLENTNGEYVGVGVQVSQDVDTKIITVVKVFDGPAKEAGIEADDILKKVDGVDITDLQVDAVVDRIGGKKGTEVSITVYRPSDASEHEYTMKRQKIERPTVEAKMLDNNIGYVAVSSFYEVTAVQYIEAVKDLERQGMEGMIVDLRSNGGGLLDIAVEMLDFMLPEGKLVYTKDKDGNVTSEYSSTDVEQFNKPLVVLVNGYSASASEIFAGAIKDYGTGTLVGTTTFGKGIVQRLFELKDGSAIKLTIAKYFTPNGNDIHKVGIEPDIEVELDVDAYKESNGEKDNQLEAAINEMMKKLGKAPVDTTAGDETDSSEINNDTELSSEGDLEE
ncbi:MAG: S41 family peptidase [Lachnospiraceae bacterium]